MKNVLLSLALLLPAATVIAQGVAIGTTKPNASAVLELKSSTRGFLMPRNSTTGRTSIASPAKGLMLYDTTSGSFWFHNGNSWVQMASGSSGWSLKGNAGTNAGNFIGTTDARPLNFRINNLPSGVIDFESPWKTAFGHLALQAATGTANSAFGYEALYTDTSGSGNTASGFQSLYATSLGSYNTGIGAASLFTNTTGNYNTASGYFSLFNNLDGYSNTASGYYAMFANNYGHGNAGFGTNAVNSNTTGIYNSGFGYASLYSSSTGNYNTACGAASLYNNNGSYNTASGFEALRLNGESYNTAVGFQALRNTTAAQYNVAVGYHAGGSLDNGYNNVFVGANTDVNGIGYYNVIAIGQATVCTSPSQVTMGNSATGSYRAYANWSNISDGRFKKNIREDIPGLKFIMDLKPVSYSLDATGMDRFLHKNAPASQEANANAKALFAKALIEKEQKRCTGFVAQDVEQSAKKLGFNFSGVDAPANENDLYALRYADFVVPLVKAMQEQQQVIVQQQHDIATLQQQLAELAKKVNALMSR